MLRRMVGGVGPADVVLAGPGARRHLPAPARAAGSGERRRRGDDKAQVAPRPVGLAARPGAARCNPLLPNRATRRSRRRPLAERVAALRDPDVPRACSLSHPRPADAGGRGRVLDGVRPHVRSRRPARLRADAASSSIAARAGREGRDPLDLAYDLVLSDGGQAISTCRSSTTPTATSTRPARCSPTRKTVIGSGDGGAHVGTICDGSFPTTLLTYWARDRDHGRLRSPVRGAAPDPRDRAHRRPARPRRARARLPRRCERDRLRAPHRPPARDPSRPPGRRQTVRAAASGYTATLVAGEVTYENGEACGPLPGRLVRGPQLPAGGATP